MKTESDNKDELVTLSDDRLRQLIDAYDDENLPPQETLSIDTIKRYCRMCQQEEGSDSDKASEYEDYIWKTLRLFNDVIDWDSPNFHGYRNPPVFDQYAPREMVRLPQIDSLDEDLAGCLSPVRCRLVLPNVKDISKDCLDLLFSRKNKITLSRKYYHYHCLEIGLESLDKAQATVLGRYTGQLSLPNLEAIDAEAASKLRGIAWNLRLGIREIDLDTAKALTDLPKKSQGRNLYLDRLKSVSPDVLKALCQNEGRLSLGLEDVNTEQMAMLAGKPGESGLRAKFELPELRHCSTEALEQLVEYDSEVGSSEFGSLELNSLEELSAEEAEILGKTKKPSLCLNGLKSIPADVAKSLSSFRGKLFLEGIAEISAEAAGHLANIRPNGDNHHLELGVRTIDTETAGNLAGFEGSLNLPGLTELSAAAAGELAAHKGKWLYLGVKSIPDETAKALAGYEGELYLMKLEVLQNAALAEKLASMDCPKLENLTTLSEDAAAALADSEGDLELNGLRELGADVAKALARHKGDELSLNGLTELSDQVAEALSKHEGYLYLGGLSGLSENAAKALGQHKGQINDENPGKWLKSMRGD